MGALPRLGINSMPGPPARQDEHERRYTPFTHPFMLTRRIWKVDYCGLKLTAICLTGEEKPRKNLTQEISPDGVRTWARCVTGAHATACSLAVNSGWNLFILKIQTLHHYTCPKMSTFLLLFYSKRNVHETFSNLHIKINLKIYILETIHQFNWNFVQYLFSKSTRAIQKCIQSFSGETWE